MNGTFESIRTGVCEEPLSPAKTRYNGRSENVFRRVNLNVVVRMVIAFALTVAVADWFSAIRSPLWLDETGSYWSIAGGFWQIWSRQGLSFPAYSYILWLTKSLFGPSEVVLRMPSVIAMLGAVYVLYRIAREFFEADVAAIVIVIFCIHPIVSFAAIDARPYAFAILSTNCAILTLLRWMKTNSKTDAVLFGAATAGIFYFHYLFSVIIAAFVLLVLIAKRRELRTAASKLAVALIPFALMMPPVLARLLYLVQTRQSHVYAGLPLKLQVVYTLAPGNIGLVFVGAAFLAVIMQKFAAPDRGAREAINTALVLGAVPLAILYFVSSLTPIHVFLPRYTLVALPGLALCWGLLVARLNSRFVRVVFCLGLIVFTFDELPGSTWKSHGYSWKDALQVADANVASDHAPLLIASGFVESNSAPLPTDVSDSPMFSPLGYYKVHTRVVPLPRDLTPVAKAQVSNFLSTATPARQRFLVLIHGGEYQPMGKWITSITKEHYEARQIGVYDDITVTEYVPR